ncbi:hypothetical protein AAC387_Pa03g3002 [Persea americana]
MFYSEICPWRISTIAKADVNSIRIYDFNDTMDIYDENKGCPTSIGKKLMQSRRNLKKCRKSRLPGGSASGRPDAQRQNWAPRHCYLASGRPIPCVRTPDLGEDSTSSCFDEKSPGQGVSYSQPGNGPNLPFNPAAYRSQQFYQHPNPQPPQRTPSFEETVLQELKELKAYTQLVHSHSQSIAKLETQIRQIANALNRREEGRLPSQPTVNPKNTFEVGNGLQPKDTYHEQANIVVTLRNGHEIETRPKEPKHDLRQHTSHPKASRVELVSKGNEVTPPNSSSDPTMAPPYVPKAPFPTCLDTPSPFSKKRATMDEILDVFKQVKINLSLLDAIKQVPSYAKFLKDLCTQKCKSKFHVPKKVLLTEQVSSIIHNDTPPRLKDPGTPTIPCTIRSHVIDHALLNLGASVNLLPYSVYEQIGLEELKPTQVTLQLAARSVRVPRGIIEDVLVKVDKFFFPIDFIILDTEPVQNSRKHTPVILGRPFLATANANINCRTRVMDVSFWNMKVWLHAFRASHRPLDQDECFAVDVVDELVEHDLHPEDTLLVIIAHDLSDGQKAQILERFLVPNLEEVDMKEVLSHVFLQVLWSELGSVLPVFLHSTFC